MVFAEVPKSRFGAFCLYSLVVVVFSLVLMAFSAGAYADNLNPVAEWRMDEEQWTGAAGEVLDSVGSYSGQARTAGNDNSLPTPTEAHVCNGGRFRGQGYNVASEPYYIEAQHYVEIADAPALSPLAQNEEISLSGWFMAGEMSTNSLIHKGGSSQEYQIAIENQRLRAVFWNENNTPGTLVMNTGAPLSTSQWYFFGVSGFSQGNSLIVSIYVFDEQGNLVGENNARWNNFFRNYEDKLTNGSLVLGGIRYGDGGEPTNYFDGTLDEVRLHDRALSQTEFETLLQDTRPCGASASPLPVTDTFETYEPGSLIGQNGGEGWGAPWQAASGQTIVDTSTSPLDFTASNGLSIRSDSTLELTGNNSRIVARGLKGNYTGDRIYLSTLVRFLGTAGANNFAGFWIQNPGFGESPQFGVKTNEGGSGSRDFFVRLDQTAAYSTEFVPGQTYLLVAEFQKGGGQFYNQGRLWVNPQCTDAPPPTPSAETARNPAVKVTQVAELGFRTENLNGSQKIQIGQVAAGENWSDVVNCVCYQNGLEATYFNGYASSQPFPAETGTPDLTRLDPTVNFGWASGSPDPAVNPDDFGIQWQGAVEVPQTGLYRFQVRTDDGVRLWVDDLDNPVIDDWVDRSAADSTTDQIYLEAGRRYGIRMQYYERGGLASARLSWQRPGASAFEVIPEANLFACLPVKAPELLSVSSVCGTQGSIRASFAQSSRSRPLDAASASNPSFYQLENAVSGQRVTVSSATPESDGYSVLLQTASPLDSEASYRLTVSDVQDVGGEVMAPNPDSVEFAAAGNGLVTDYWNNMTLSGSAQAQGTSPQIDFEWGSGSPLPGIIGNDRFSVRWRGYIVPQETGTYRFRTRSDDGVRLWVGDLSSPIINQWNDHSPTDHTAGAMTLQKGQVYPIRMEMYENGGGAVARLSWQTPSNTGYVVVPSTVLYSCPDLAQAVDHFRISHGGTALTCTPAPVTIAAVDNNGELVADYTGTIALSTSTDDGDWLGGGSGALDPGGGNSGRAEYTFAESDGGSVTLNLSHTSAGAVNIDVTDGEANESSDYDDDLTFAKAGFVFHREQGLGAHINALIAGKPSNDAPGAQAIQLTAVRENDMTGACETYLTNEQEVELGYVCKNPTTCAIDNGLKINGQSIAGNDDGPNSNATTLTLDFGEDPSTSSTLVLNYADAGQITLFARAELKDAEGNPTGETIAGASNAIVSVPAGFCIQATEANASCVSGDANCSAFKAAREAFDVTYRAVAWQEADESGPDFCSGNATTPNFRFTNMPIEYTLVAPAGGEKGKLFDGFGLAETSAITFAAQEEGILETSHQLTEVGVFKFSVGEGAYMGEALPSGVSDFIGRFIPADFLVEKTDGALTPGCDAGGFLYAGQPTKWRDVPALTITARNTQGDTTKNYTKGAFQKLTASDVDVEFPDSLAVTTTSADGSPSSVTVGLEFDDSVGVLSEQSGGVMTYTFADPEELLTFTKNDTSRIDPYVPEIKLPIDSLDDSDGVAANPLPDDITPDVPFNVRYGRLRMENVYGPETAGALEMLSFVEQWQGGRFVTNGDENCPAPAMSQLSNTAKYHSMTSTSANMNNGILGPLKLEPSGRGTDTLSWDVPAWLEHDWDGDGISEDPSATATFGVYRGHDRVIYWREVP